MLPVLLTEGHHARGLPLERISELVEETPARLMGLSHAKGRIAPGLDADLVLVDLDAEWVLRREDVVSAAGYSIYEGRRFKGAIRHTFVRGTAVVEGGTLVEGARGTGRYQRRKLEVGV
jgi:dihydroorotase-like cyclic amidohydrolase